MVIIVFMGIFDILSLKQQQKETEQNYQAKTEEVEKLERMQQYISSDEYIEQTARDLFKMVKPGEILYILEEEEENASENVLQEKEIVVPDTLPQQEPKDTTESAIQENEGGASDEEAPADEKEAGEGNASQQEAGGEAESGAEER